MNQELVADVLAHFEYARQWSLQNSPFDLDSTDNEMHPNSVEGEMIQCQAVIPVAVCRLPDDLDFESFADLLDATVTIDSNRTLWIEDMPSFVRNLVGIEFLDQLTSMAAMEGRFRKVTTYDMAKRARNTSY